MIPTTYKTEAEAKVIRTTHTEGSKSLDNMYYTGTAYTNPSLDGVISSEGLYRIQNTNLTGVTSVIDITVSGNFTADDAAYITGMRDRITESITNFYASKPNLSPFNANNKQAGQSDANVRDNFLQAIFRYDARYGQRMRLSETEVIEFNDTGSYQLPNRTAFLKNPYIEATLRLHGVADIVSIDDTGVGGAYRVTTSTHHGLYDGMLVAKNFSLTPTTPTTLHEARTVTSLTQDFTTADSAPANSYYTTSANHNFITGQKFIPGSSDLGVTGLDPSDTFIGYQRDRYIKVINATTFELHRNLDCTDRIEAGFYAGDLTFSQPDPASNTAMTVLGGTIQPIDGAPVIFTAVTSSTLAVFQRDVISSVDTLTGVWTTTATINNGILDGMLADLRGFTGTNWDGVDFYNHPLYFKKLTNTTFSLHTSPTTLDSTTLWIPGTTSNTDVESITFSGGWNVTFNRPHGLLSGQDFRFKGVGAEFGGQSISSYTYAGNNSANNYWTLPTTSDHIQDGSRITISTLTSTGAGTTFDIATTQVTVPQNGLYVKRRGAAGSKQVQLFTDSAMTTQWQPYTTVGTHTVEANTFLANIYFAGITGAQGLTIKLYKDPGLTVLWNPNDGYGAVSEIYSGANGSITATDIVTTYSSPGAGYLQPMFFTRTTSYTGFELYRDKGLTLPYIAYNGAVNGVDVNSVMRMNSTSHYMSWFDTGNSTNVNVINFTANPTLFPAVFVKSISETVFDLYVNSGLSIPYNTPAIGTTGVGGGLDAAQFQQNGNFRFDKIICRNIGLLTYYYNNYNTGQTLVNATQSGTFYPAHYQSNLVFNFDGQALNWPDMTIYEYANTNAGTYYGHLRPTKAGSSDAGNTGRVGVDATIWGVTQGSPVVYRLSQPGRFTTQASMILGLKEVDDVGTYTEDPLEFNGAQWDQGAEGQPYRDWPQTVQPVSLTWTIEQPTQVLETINMNRYTRTRDISQYRLKLTYPPMTKSQLQEYVSIIHAAGGAYKPFRFWFPRNNNIPMTVSMTNKSTQMPTNFFVREALSAGTKIIKVDGLPQNKTQNDPAMFAGSGCNMRIHNGMGSMMVPIHNVRTNEYGEANIRINNGIPANIAIGNWMDSYINYLDVFLDGNSLDIKVDTRGFHTMEVDMVTKRVF